MNGAHQYSSLFNRTEQIGRLFISSGHHARGRTLHVWVLPEGFEQPEGTWPGNNAVEVYGVTGGQPGWTESYGWLRVGQWQQDFDKIVAERREAAAKYQSEKAAKDEAERQAKAERERDLLSTYQRGAER